jgi:uncharacterized protein YhbP (UPF0306 family)
MTGNSPPTSEAARAIIDETLYMVLATADESGRPWASPVYFAPDGYQDFYWVSSVEAQHSRNIAVRSQVGIVIFDSRAVIGTGQGVYMEAEAVQLSAGDLERGLSVFSARSIAHGGHPWASEDLPDAGLMRMYRAQARVHSMLAKDGQPDHRLVVRVLAD